MAERPGACTHEASLASHQFTTGGTTAHIDHSGNNGAAGDDPVRGYSSGTKGGNSVSK